MTKQQKKLWDLLPTGEWVKRDEMHERYGKWKFQGALTVLHKNKLIELKFVEDVQFMRKRTIEEITKNYKQS